MKANMKITAVTHVILYGIIVLVMYLGAYWAGNHGSFDARLRPVFAKLGKPLKWHDYSMLPPATDYGPAAMMAPLMAPMPVASPPVPLVTLAAANEMPSPEYAPYLSA